MPSNNETDIRPSLLGWADGNPTQTAIAETIIALADAAGQLAELVARGPLVGNLAGVVGENADGDAQKVLDLRAHELFTDAVAHAPVGIVGSEEADDPIVLDADKPITVVMDPLDGSSNIEINNAIGTIFGLLPTPASGDPTEAVLQPGRHQLASGFVLYGAFTAMMLTVGDGVSLWVYDPERQTFVKVRERVRVPPGRRMIAINASNRRHWSAGVQAFFDDCLAGAEGPFEGNFNQRWSASVVGEAYRILTRGGVFMYPDDAREGYEQGRLRLVYEANPIALLMAQAGGSTSTLCSPMLDEVPRDLHQRTPLVFGDAKLVEQLCRYERSLGRRTPLFGARSLFQQSRG